MQCLRRHYRPGFDPRVKRAGVKECSLAGHVSEEARLDLHLSRARWGGAAMRQDPNWIAIGYHEIGDTFKKIKNKNSYWGCIAR